MKQTIIIGAVLAVGWLTCATEPFDYFADNWNVIGLRDYQHGSRLSPNNELWLAGRTPIQVCVGRELAPLHRRHGKQALDGWLPILTTAVEDGPVRYQVTFWATPLPDAKDWQAAFQWPTEGENYLNWICVTATNTGRETVSAQATVRPNPAIRFPGHPEEQSESGGGQTHTRQFQWTWTLAGGQSATGVARYPFFPGGDPNRYDDADAALWLRRTVEHWQATLNRAAHISVPCRKATEALRAAHVCQLIANDHGEVRGGEGFYDTFYIRDGAYQVLELEEAGVWDAAKKSVELYLPRQRPDGRFESQAGQFDANGQAVWVLWQYARITGDRAWLERVYPAMRRAVDWTVKARRQAPADSPFAGLLPNALADGENLWDGKYHIVGYDFWNLRGLLCTADAARRLGKSEEAAELDLEVDLYRQAIEAAWRRTGLAHFPPSWELVGTHWGNTETLWPTPLFDLKDARVAALSRFLRREFDGGFVEGIIRWGKTDQGVIHPYMGAYTTMADLIRGDHEQVVEDFYWYLLHSTAAHAFPEGIYYRRRFAWSETIPHVTGACNYAIMLRHMLVHEQGEELRLLSTVPDWWLEAGQEIRIERLPTWFGELNLLVRGTAGGVEVKLDPPKRTPPQRIVLHLPETRRPIDRLRGAELATRPPQQQRWDFPTVVERYENSNPADICPKPEAVSLTTGKPASCSSELPAFPASLANDGFASDTDSYWATDVAAQKDPTPWWQVDLEQPKQVGRVVVVGYYADRRHYGFTVEGSLDGKVWAMLADRRDNQEPATSAGYTCTFIPATLRYLRVTQTRNSANTGRHLVEVMAFDK
jgi:hypothetical protein